jgi:hypothetical protein
MGLDKPMGSVKYYLKAQATVNAISKIDQRQAKLCMGYLA